MDDIESQLTKSVASLIPGELNVHVRVPLSRVPTLTMPTPLVTTYRQSALPGAAYYEKFADHIFVQNIDGPGNYMTFIFVKDRTETLTTAVPSLSRPLTEPHLWKTCLLQLGAIEDATTPLNAIIGGETVEIPRLYPRMRKLPGGIYPTEVDLLTYVSHRPFTRAEMGKLETQVTTQVTFHGVGLSINEDCMHGLVEFPETQTSGKVKTGFGTVDNPLAPNGRMVFPPTPMKKWRRYLFDQKHDFVEGEYRLQQLWANPPQGIRAILDSAN